LSARCRSSICGSGSIMPKGNGPDKGKKRGEERIASTLFSSRVWRGRKGKGGELTTDLAQNSIRLQKKRRGREPLAMTILVKFFSGACRKRKGKRGRGKRKVKKNPSGIASLDGGRCGRIRCDGQPI